MISPRLIREMRERYQVGERHARAYLEYWLQPGGRMAGRSFASLAEILALPPPDSTWFDYAMSTTQRGRALAEGMLALPQAPRGGRYLDIGCGFGGLLAAFAERGFAVRGIELDPVRVRMARATCDDHGLADVVSPGDILDEQLVASLGRFDLVTMIDVIEHVLDVPKALRHAVDLLEPGGLLLLEVPNRHSMNFIAADGHFAAFAITLLDRPQAVAYHAAVFGTPYDVGDYFELADYGRQLEALGCTVTQVGSPHHAPRPLGHVPSLVTTIQRAMEEYEAHTAPRLPASLQTTVQLKLSQYLSQLTADLAAARDGDRASFINRYLIDFWTLAATRTGSAAPGEEGAAIGQGT
jgi:2-polyprenyl-3-methyl-5-hydroxy-6-metoxy-1,4-benzoquinol methylase